MGAAKIFFVVFFICACLTPAQAQKAIPLATGEWAPFTSRSLPGQGPVSELVRKVFSQMGREAEISFYPWNRCYEMVLSGAAWGAFPYSWTEGRADEVLFSDTISYSDSGWFFVGSPPVERYERLEDMKGLRIGGIAGYFYEEAFSKARLEVEYAPDEESVLKMLLAGRVDVAIMNVLVAGNIIRKQFPDKADGIFMLDGLYSRNKLRMIVSPSYPGARELLESFNEALRQCGGPVSPPQTITPPGD